jgi:prevent-host-death family protein
MQAASITTTTNVPANKHPTVSIKDFRNNLAKYFGWAVYRQEPIRVKKYNETAVLISEADYEEYEQLINPHTRLSEQEWSATVAVIDEIRSQIPQYPIEEVERDIAQALAEVRSNQSKHK